MATQTYTGNIIIALKWDQQLALLYGKSDCFHVNLEQYLYAAHEMRVNRSCGAAELLCTI